MDVINDFDNEFFFLSNFTYSPFVVSSIKWDTVEHYFQAMKTTDLDLREKIKKVGHPRFAKKFGKILKLRNDWEDIKYGIMKQAVGYKFTQNQKYREMLIDTHPAKLIEGNSWHDNIWGDCYCVRCKNIEGKNLLGKILMDVRSELML